MSRGLRLIKTGLKIYQKMLNVVAAGNLGDVFLICIKLLQYSRSLASTVDIVHIHGPTAKTKQLDQLYKFVLWGGLRVLI